MEDIFTEEKISEYQIAISEERKKLFNKPKPISLRDVKDTPVGTFTSAEALNRMRIKENPRWMKVDD